MMYLAAPCGNNFGWGVVGKYLIRELAKLDQIRLLQTAIAPNTVATDLEHRYLTNLLATPAEFQRLQDPVASAHYPVLQVITGPQLEPIPPRVKGRPLVGHAVFEVLLNRDDVRRAAEYFDIIATACTWCADTLRDNGFPRVTTVVQGIDPLVFHPGYADKEWFKDQFVIYSGGKLEFRKGQDIVIRAFKILQDKYRDVLLVTSWYNLWAATAQMMALSPHIRFRPIAGDYVTYMNQLLADNGIDPGRVVTLPLIANEQMPRVYQNSDVGLFPNRCEGATNLVMMEYMACGKPVIATFGNGQRDVLTADNAILLKNLRQLTLMQGAGRPHATWDDPDLDEVVARLEWAYHHREQLRPYARQAGLDMAARYTWAHTARGFHRILTSGAN